MPLVRSITSEIRERGGRLAVLEAERLAHTVSPSMLRLCDAEIATQRREIRRAESELEKLACYILSWNPFTVRIDVVVQGEPRSMMWTQDP